jgi:hypothetical protein
MAAVLLSRAHLMRFTVRHLHHLRHLLIIGAGKVWKNKTDAALFG